jgi:hypothetical protein
MICTLSDAFRLDIPKITNPCPLALRAHYLWNTPTLWHFLTLNIHTTQGVGGGTFLRLLLKSEKDFTPINENGIFISLVGIFNCISCPPNIISKFLQVLYMT